MELNASKFKELKRIQKPIIAVCQIKRNISNKAASQQRFKPKQDMLSESLRTAYKRGKPARPAYRSRESLQFKGAKWNANGQLSGHKEPQLKLQLLPPCIYAKRDYLLLLISL